MVLVPISDGASELRSGGTDLSIGRGPHDDVKALREDLQKLSKTWETYQEKRTAQGKTNRDWTPTLVRLAYMQCASKPAFFLRLWSLRSSG